MWAPSTSQASTCGRARKGSSRIGDEDCARFSCLMPAAYNGGTGTLKQIHVGRVMHPVGGKGSLRRSLQLFLKPHPPALPAGSVGVQHDRQDRHEHGKLKQTHGLPGV